MYKSPDMFIRILFPLLIVILTGCQNRSDTSDDGRNADSSMQNTAEEDLDRPDHLTYFTAAGTEPLWSLEIGEDMIKFMAPGTGFEEFFTPHIEPDQAMDANVKRYRAETEAGELVIQIVSKNCGAPSASKLPYEVRVSIRRGKNGDFTEFIGCGAYVPDYRLYDIWALQSLNGVKVDPEEYGNEIPYIEINTNKMTFMGFAGCNTVEGEIFNERNLLRFTNIVTTLMACPGNAESPFLRALRSVTTYQREGADLHLSNPDGELMVFRKVD